MAREEASFSEEYVSASLTESQAQKPGQRPTSDDEDPKRDKKKYKTGKPVRVTIRASIMHGHPDN
jgi:hypothetical protein